VASLTIQMRDRGSAYEPGARLSGTASWLVAATPRTAVLRLLWYTRGKGTSDAQVVDEVDFPAPRQSETRDFSFDLPGGPYSFSGKLISLVWALELVVEPGPDVERLDFVLAPGGAEVTIDEALAPYEGA